MLMINFDLDDLFIVFIFVIKIFNLVVIKNLMVFIKNLELKVKFEKYLVMN